MLFTLGKRRDKTLKLRPPTNKKCFYINNFLKNRPREVVCLKSSKSVNYKYRTFRESRLLFLIWPPGKEESQDDCEYGK